MTTTTTETPAAAPAATAPAAPITLDEALADGKAHSLPELVQATDQPEDIVREQLASLIDDLRVQVIFDGRAARRSGGRVVRKYRSTP